MNDAAEDTLQLLRVAEAMAKDAENIRQQIVRSVLTQQRRASTQHLTDCEEFFPIPAICSQKVTTVSSSSRSASTQRSHAPATTPPSSSFSPSSLHLLRHQRDGVRWLLALHQLGLHGILADEMGLGKTVQVLAFFAALATQGTLGTYLVVAPLSTLSNWHREVRRWLPWVHVCVFHGSHDERQRLRARLRRRHRRAFEGQHALRTQWAEGAPITALAEEVGAVVLTSYEAVMADHGALIRLLPWDVTVVDEAHRLKNLECKLLSTLRKVDCPMRLILTGTPLQNNMAELWTLLEYVAPWLFQHDDAWQRRARDAIANLSDSTGALQKNNRGDAGDDDDDEDDELDSRKASTCQTPPAVGKKKGEDCLSVSHTSDYGGLHPSQDRSALPHHLLSHLKTALQTFMLRRTKSTAGIQLPPKYDLYIPTPLTVQQRTFYERIASQDRYSASRPTHLRKCCVHPFLFPEFRDEAAAKHCPSSNEWNSSDVPRQDDAAEQLELLLKCSGKLQMLDAMLPELRRRGHRVLLFSQMTKALDLVEEYLVLKNRVAEAEMTHGEVSWATADTVEDNGGEAGAVPTQVAASMRAMWSRVLPYVRLDGSSTTQERCEAIRLFQATSQVQSSMERSTEDGVHQTAAYAGEGKQMSDLTGQNLCNAKQQRQQKQRRQAPSTRRCQPSRRPEEFLCGVAEDDAVFDEVEARPPARLPNATSHLQDAVVLSTPHSFLTQRDVNRSTPVSSFKPQGAVKACYADMLSSNTSLLQGTKPFKVNEAAEPAGVRGGSAPMCAARGTPPALPASAPPTACELFLFLISTRAGGAGLNLTGADTVILLDGDYNPQNDAQAVDRCHRIGQTKSVVVYRLVSPGTVEDERHLTIVRRKLKLGHLVLGEGIDDGDGHRQGPMHAQDVLEESGEAQRTELPRKRRRAADQSEVVQSEITEAQLQLLLNRTWLLRTCPTAN